MLKKYHEIYWNNERFSISHYYMIDFKSHLFGCSYVIVFWDIYWDILRSIGWVDDTNTKNQLMFTVYGLRDMGFYNSGIAGLWWNKIVEINWLYLGKYNRFVVWMKVMIISLYFIGDGFSFCSTSVPSWSQGSWARNN